MSLFGGAHTRTIYGALIDIGSGSVGVGIVASDRSNETPNIIYTHREQMRVRTRDLDRAELIRKMRETLFSASLALSTEGLQKLSAHNPKARISRILVTCSSPWAHTISRNVSYQNETTFRVTRSLIENLKSDAEEKIEDEMQETMIVGKLGLHTVERATVDVKVNGYSTSTPIGKDGKDIELSHVIGLIPEEILETTHEIQEKILTDTELSMHTFMFTHYCVLRDILDDMDSLSIVDVTGETTEIGVVEDDRLRESQHTSYGAHTLIREVTKLTDGTPEHACTLLRGYAEETLNKGDTEMVEQAIEAYSNTLTETLKTMHAAKPLPKRLTVTAVPGLEELFAHLVASAFTEVLQTECAVLDTSRKVREKLALTDETDIFIAFSCGFFHKLHGCGEIDTL